MKAMSDRYTKKGFTLIELLVVLAILIAVSALVIPKLGFVQSQTGNAVSAVTSGQLISHIEGSRVSAGSYPLGMDSLLESTSGTPSGIYGDLWSHSAGPFQFGVLNELEIGTLTNGSGEQYLQSFGHAFHPDSNGEIYIYDHSAAPAADPNNSGSSRRVLQLGGSDQVAFVIPAPASPPYLPGTPNRLVKAAGYSTGVIPAGTKLIAFGVGPHMGTIGESMASTPRHMEQDSKVYGRYIAIYAVYASGKPAQLKTVVDSEGVALESNINDYAKSAPSHQ